MAKYNTEFKVKVVNEYLIENLGYKELAKKYNISNKAIVRRWVNAFKIQSYDGLKMSSRNNNYTLDFRLQTKCSKLILNRRNVYQSLANELKITNQA